MGALFPAGAGMNRSSRPRLGLQFTVPRRRGDEPAEEAATGTAAELFPAGAGMNRRHELGDASTETVPRRRGDEPLNVAPDPAPVVCSPQARG